MSEQQRRTLETMLRNGPLDLHDPVEKQRAIFAEMMSAFPLPADLTLTDDHLNGVPVVTITAGDTPRTGTILYFHGGAYVTGTARLAASLVAELVRRTGAHAVSVDYTLAPEARFPTPVTEAVTAYRALLDHGHPAQSIVFAGESAGGGLALAAALAARDAGLPQPAAIYTASPWADMTLSGESVTTNAAVDPSVSVEGLTLRAADYLGGKDARDPLASPVFADLTGLAPLLIQTGGVEVLLDDTTRLAVHAAHAGVHVITDVVPDVPHVFVAFAGIIDEASDALDRAGTFLHTALRPSPA